MPLQHFSQFCVKIFENPVYSAFPACYAGTVTRKTAHAGKRGERALGALIRTGSAAMLREAWVALSILSESLYCEGCLPVVGEYGENTTNIYLFRMRGAHTAMARPVSGLS